MPRMQYCATHLLAIALAGGMASAVYAESFSVPRTADAGQKRSDQIERSYESRIRANRERKYVDQQLWLMRQERARERSRPSPLPLDVPVFQSTPRQ